MPSRKPTPQALDAEMLALVGKDTSGGQAFALVARILSERKKSDKARSLYGLFVLLASIEDEQERGMVIIYASLRAVAEMDDGQRVLRNVLALFESAGVQEEK